MVFHFPGSDECPFPRPLNDSKDWSPESPDTSCSRPQRIHSCTQTEAPQPIPAASDITDPPALLPAAPPLPSCPSPVRKERHCAKWENREEDSKPTYECLESVSVAAAPPSPHILKAKCTDHSALPCLVAGQPQVGQSKRDTTREAEGGRAGGGHAEDAAEEACLTPCGGGLLLIHTHSTSGRLVLPPYGRIYKPKVTL